MKIWSLLVPLGILGILSSLYETGSAAPEVPGAEALRAAEKPLKVLIITGGCCHDYTFQSAAMIEGITAQVPAEFAVVHEGGNGTKAQLEMYDDPSWAKPYDVVIHNECFADTADEAYISKIVKAHREGAPAVVVHCAMHTYRAAKHDLWREFLGLTSRHHEDQGKYPVKVELADHPIMAGFPGKWTTPLDELYIVEKRGPKLQVLASAPSAVSGEVQPVMWTNDYHGVRVAGTTFGHTNDTFRDPVFLKFLARSVVWAAGRTWKKEP